MQLNLELFESTENRAYRQTYPIPRPEGFDDATYTLHAANIAEMSGKLLMGYPRELLRVVGVTIMVVEEGLLDEKQIREQFNEAIAQQIATPGAWRGVHIIQPVYPQSG